jgi:hypothetical protein
MSNYAALVSPICLCGCLTNAGTPNVNGKVWAYKPGTTTPANIYADPAATITVTQPVTLDTGGRVPYATYPNGIYTTQPIRLLIQDANGNAVSDTTFESSAPATGLANASWPNETTVDQAFTALGASLGGSDGNYQESPGATPRTIHGIFQGLQVTPQDFGAKGDGISDDTAAVQAALTEIVRLGSGVVYFAAGTYKISNALNLPTMTGVTLRGAGFKASSITQTASVNVLNVAAVNGLGIYGLTLTGSFAPAALALTGTTNIDMSQVFLNAPVAGGVGLSVSGIAALSCVNSALVGGAIAVKMAGNSTNLYFANVNPGSSTTAFQFASGFTGGNVTVQGSPLTASSATPFDMSTLSTDPGLVQYGNDVEAISYTTAANTIQIKLSDGYNPIITAPNGQGPIITVSNPIPTPSTSSTRAVFLNMTFINATGGNVAWSLGSQFILPNSIPLTTGHTYNVTCRWDPIASKWRGITLSDTTT